MVSISPVSAPLIPIAPITAISLLFEPAICFFAGCQAGSMRHGAGIVTPADRAGRQPKWRPFGQCSFLTPGAAFYSSPLMGHHSFFHLPITPLASGPTSSETRFPPILHLCYIFPLINIHVFRPIKSYFCESVLHTWYPMHGQNDLILHCTPFQTDKIPLFSAGDKITMWRWLLHLLASQEVSSAILNIAWLHDSSNEIPSHILQAH